MTTSIKEEGWGTSQGVNYTFALTKGKWFCHYECRVHRLLFERDIEEFLTEEFTVGGFNWQLKLQNLDGQFGVFVKSRTQNKVGASHVITIKNHISPSYDITKQNEREFYVMNQCRGHEALTTTSSIKGPKNGFLYGDSISIVLRLRVVTPENELSSLMNYPNTSIFTWALKDLHEIDPGVPLLSERFTCNDHKWSLCLYPNGDTMHPKYMSLYLRLEEESPVKIKSVITVQNHRTGRDNISRKMETKYDELGNQGQGFSDLLPTKVLQNKKGGFVSEGWFTITCQINILDYLKSTPKKATVRLFTKNAASPRKEPARETSCICCDFQSATPGIDISKLKPHLCGNCMESMEQLAKEKAVNCPVCKTAHSVGTAA